MKSPCGEAAPPRKNQPADVIICDDAETCTIELSQGALRVGIHCYDVGVARNALFCNYGICVSHLRLV